MKYLRPLLLLATAAFAQTPKPFTLQQALSAPYATDLTAAPAGNQFAWVEDEEGRHNLYVGGANTPARALTHNTEDDAQDISQISWSPDAKTIAFTYGAPGGADARPANPAHLQRPTPVRVMLVGTSGNATVVTIGEGRSPLFTRDGKGLLFIRDGQIWLTCLQDCHADGDASHSSPAMLARQLVYDRGSAGALTLSPDGRTLAFISRRRELNEPAHTLLALYSFTTHTLTFPAPSTGNDSAPAFSPDGKELAWIRNPFTEIAEFANPRTSATPWSIQLLDLTPCAVSTGSTASNACHPEQSEGPASPARNRTVYEPEPNKQGSVLPDLPGGSPSLLWSVNHRIVFYSEADGWLHLYRIGTENPEAPQLLTPGRYEVGDAVITADGTNVVLSANGPELWPSFGDAAKLVPHPEAADRRLLFKIDLTSNKPVAVPPTIGGSAIFTHPQITANGSIAALVSDDREPMHPEIVDMESSYSHTVARQFLRRLTKHSLPFVMPEQALFEATDGVALHGQLFLPQEKAGPSPAARNDTVKGGKRPALIFVHGGPMRQMLLGFPAMDYYSNAYAMNQYLTSLGFIVLSVNYRCGIGYGLEFHQCQNAGANGATEYNDVLAAQKYLASRNDVDVKRIGIWGGSYGGYLTALALARNSDLFAAGVDFHGVHDWNLEDNASDWKRGSFAQQDVIAAKALRSSPLADLSQWRSPILLIHGDNDPSVAYAETPILADALRARNASLPKNQQVDVKELVFPDEVHEFALHKDWLVAYEATAAFFERTLKPEPVK